MIKIIKLNISTWLGATLLKYVEKPILLCNIVDINNYLS